MKHHLMIGTWTPPGAIFTVEFDDEAGTLKLVERTPIPEDEPISWMTFDVSTYQILIQGACQALSCSRHCAYSTDGKTSMEPP